MKTTHKLSISTGTVSAVLVLISSIGALLGWNLAPVIASIGGILAMLANAAFAVLTSTKLAQHEPKAAAIVTDVANVAQEVAEVVKSDSPESEGK